MLRSLVHRTRGGLTIPLLLLTAHALRLSSRAIGITLVYHRVGPRSRRPALELMPAVPAAVFTRQLALARCAFRLVPATALAPAARSRRRGGRIPMAITFDDDIRGHALVSARRLRRLRVPATFFLGGVGMGRWEGYWWDDLQAAVDDGLIGDVLDNGDAPSAVAAAWTGQPESIHHVAAAIVALDPVGRAEVTRLIAASIPAERRVRDPLTRSEIQSLALAGFEIGFHTLDHDYLPAVADQQLSEALTRGRGRLAELSGQPISAIAYPHGGADERVAQAARTAGYVAGFTTRSEAVHRDSDDLLLGRIEGPHQSAAGLAARLHAALRGPRA